VNAALFVGPTNSTFGIDPIIEQDDVHDIAQVNVPFTTEHRPTSLQEQNGANSVSPTDILAVVTHHEALRLLDVYDERISSLYPFVDIRAMKHHASTLYREESTVATPITKADNPELDWSFARDVQALKLLLACSLAIEGSKFAKLAKDIAYDGQNRILSRFEIVDVDLKELLIVTLVVCAVRS